MRSSVWRQNDRPNEPIRYVSVRKLRGSNFLSGDHVYRITAGGLVVFPRLADLPRRPTDVSPAEAGDRVSTGIAALDEALEDGLLVRFDHPHRRAVGRREEPLMGVRFVFAGAALRGAVGSS